jgi:hypothetical protein
MCAQQLLYGNKTISANDIEDIGDLDEGVFEA